MNRRVMKNLICKSVILLLFGFSSCHIMEEAEKTFSGLTLEEGKVYQVKGKTPDNGELTRYYENGNIRMLLRFENGEQILTINYYETGQKKSKVEKTDQGHNMTSWYKNGQKEEEILPGVVRKWYPNGQLKAEVRMNETKDYHGDMRKWCEKGTLLAHEVYENGNLAEKIK